MPICLIKYISSICAIPLHGDRLFSSVPCWKRVLDAGRQECFLIGSKCSCILVATVPKNKQMNYSSMAAAFALWSRKWNLWNLSLLNSSRGGLELMSESVRWNKLSSVCPQWKDSFFDLSDSASLWHINEGLHALLGSLGPLGLQKQWENGVLKRSKIFGIGQERKFLGHVKREVVDKLDSVNIIGRKKSCYKLCCCDLHSKYNRKKLAYILIDLGYSILWLLLFWSKFYMECQPGLDHTFDKKFLSNHSPISLSYVVAHQNICFTFMMSLISSL